MRTNIDAYQIDACKLVHPTFDTNNNRCVPDYVRTDCVRINWSMSRRWNGSVIDTVCKITNYKVGATSGRRSQNQKQKQQPDMEVDVRLRRDEQASKRRKTHDCCPSQKTERWMLME